MRDVIGITVMSLIFTTEWRKQGAGERCCSVHSQFKKNKKVVGRDGKTESCPFNDDTSCTNTSLSSLDPQVFHSAGFFSYCWTRFCFCLVCSYLGLKNEVSSYCHALLLLRWVLMHFTPTGKTLRHYLYWKINWYLYCCNKKAKLN